MSVFFFVTLFWNNCYNCSIRSNTLFYGIIFHCLFNVYFICYFYK